MGWQKSSYSASNGCVEIKFVKSSRSGLNGCVEVAFKKSSRCADTNCIEVGLKKSSYSDTNGCVEVGVKGVVATIYVRDSKNPEGPVLQFTPHEWEAFLAGVRDGEFDLIGKDGTGVERMGKV